MATSPRGIRTRGGIWNGRGRTRARERAGRRAGAGGFGQVKPPRTPPKARHSTGSGGLAVLTNRAERGATWVAR
jgi:hypothetical protein